MPKPRFNKFYRYDELTRLLKEYAKEYPNLIRIESRCLADNGHQLQVRE
jgi:hypothetical protein